METVYLSPNEVPEVLRRACRGYAGTKFKVRAATQVRFDDNAWSGGTKSDYWGLDLATGELFDPPRNDYGTPFTGGVPTVELEPGKAIVEHSRFCGRDTGITFHLHPENVALALPAPSELSADELIVLVATRSLKSSYGGISNYRLHEASGYTGITAGRWEAAKAALIGRGLLNKAGAITPAGRNAAGRTQLHEIRPQAVEV